MKKYIALILLITLIPISQSGEEKRKIEAIKIPFHSIEIDGEIVREKILFENIINRYYNDSLYFWVCVEKVEIKIGHFSLILYAENNTISLNLSQQGFYISPKGNISINLEYKIKNKFEKKIVYDTKELEIKIKTDKFLRGNIPLKYENGTYFSLFDPKIGEYIVIEFEKEKEENILPFVMGIISIFLGIFIIFLAVRKRK